MATRKAAPPRTAGSTSSSTYVFAVLRTAGTLRRKPPETLPGAGPLRLLALDESLSLAVCDVPRERYDAATIDAGLRDLDWLSARALAHERVVEWLGATQTVIPMKLFTLFESDARARTRLARRARTLRDVLDRLEGAREWGVRITVDPALARRAATRAAPVPSQASSGAGFLLARKAQQDAGKRATEIARAEAQRAFVVLSEHARQSIRRDVDQSIAGSKLALDAVLLVGETDGRSLERAAERLARDLSPLGLELVVTGPWPAYHFAGIEARA